MEENERLTMTALDAKVSPRHLQMIKAAIPYVHLTEQRFLSIYVKFLEFKNTMDFFSVDDDQLQACSLNADSSDPMNMLNDIRPFCTDSERETMDMLLNVFQAMNLYRAYQSSTSSSGESAGPANSMDALKSMLSPEQQAMFDTYSAMLSNMT